MTGESRPRILLAVTFYNGRDFARRTLESISRLERGRFDLDVLVLDDCSPEPGFSEYLAEVSREFGAVYYRSPRNIGIPRNVNLGLATAQRLGYDFVVISNSDVIYSRHSVDVLLGAVSAAPNAASATAWSTNVDPYSLPTGIELYPETQEVTDAVGEALESHFGTQTLEIPAGISFAMIIPVAVLRVVGLMDPVFGRGYGEESDWSARATNAGYQHLLAKGAFVYHAGRGSTLAAGVVAQNHIADWSNQRIVNHRSPMFRWGVDGFLRSHTLEDAQIEAVRTLVASAAARWGYAVIDGTLDWEVLDEKIVSVAIRSEANEMCTATWCGFTVEIDTDMIDVLGAIRAFFGGQEPVYTNLPPAVWEDVEQFGYPLGI